MKRQGGVRSIQTIVRDMLAAFRKYPRLARWEFYALLLLACSVILEYNARNLGLSSGTVLRLIVDRSPDVSSAIFMMSAFAILSVISVTMKSFAVGHLTRICRAALTAALTQGYFSRSAFYHLGREKLTVDNADQRLTNDIKQFCSLFVQCIDRFFICPAIIVMYSIDVYQSNGPHALASVYLFFFIGLVLQRLMGPKLIRQNIILDQLEGSYRFEHALIREDAEAICLSRATKNVQENIDVEFAHVIDQTRIVLWWQLLVNFIGNFFAYMGGVANYVILYWTRNLSELSAGKTAEAISQVSLKLCSC